MFEAEVSSARSNIKSAYITIMLLQKVICIQTKKFNYCTSFIFICLQWQEKRLLKSKGKSGKEKYIGFWGTYRNYGALHYVCFYDPFSLSLSPPPPFINRFLVPVQSSPVCVTPVCVIVLWCRGHFLLGFQRTGVKLYFHSILFAQVWPMSYLS